MNGFIRLFILSTLVAAMVSCSSRPVEDDADFDGASATEDVASDDSGDDFSDFEGGEESEEAQSTADSDSSTDSDSELDDELSEADSPKEQASASNEDSDAALDEEFSEANGENVADKEAAPTDGDELSLDGEDDSGGDKQAKAKAGAEDGDLSLDDEFSDEQSPATQAKVDEGELSLDNEGELALDDEGGGEDKVAQKPEATSGEGELSLNDEQAQSATSAPTPGVAPEIPAIDTSIAPPQEQIAQKPMEDTSIAETTPSPAVETPAVEVPAPVSMEETASSAVSTPAESTVPVATITDLKFKANESGGTIVVQADGPINYTTRANPDLNQFIIEVENARLPKRLKRSLNTKDIKGSVGAVDAYQNPGSNTARFVIQLRQGVSEPTIQVEGNSLLVVTSAPLAEQQVAVNTQQDNGVADVSNVATPELMEPDTGAEASDGQILPSQNLTEFLAGNNRFYGKKISIEINNIDIRDALGLITEESGINMVISEEVRGPLSLKLRQVPWDQALVVIMRAKKLGYTRQGNVLRIAPLQDLRAEEDDATKLAAARKTIEPLKVRMFPVSYAKVDELEKKIKDFLGDRGRVVGDLRTNSLVVTDISENLERVAKLISSLDTQPPQVLIESKIVEAQESFTRNIGVNWGASGSPIKLGSTSRGPVNMNPSFSINPSANSSGNFNFNLSVGTLDVFGTLQAALALSESEEQVKIISAPRIMTMTNEKADINQTTEVPVRQVTQNGTATQESFQFKPLTLKLEVTPQVTADGSVIMKVLVNRQFRGADVSSAGQGAFAVNSREANTKVLVKNGQTAVIGGIYQSDAVEGETGVPWLREIPIVSYLFKSKNVNKSKSELLVFLTPRVIGPVTGESSSPVEEM